MEPMVVPSSLTRFHFIHIYLPRKQDYIEGDVLFRNNYWGDNIEMTFEKVYIKVANKDKAFACRVAFRVGMIRTCHDTYHNTLLVIQYISWYIANTYVCIRHFEIHLQNLFLHVMVSTYCLWYVVWWPVSTTLIYRIPKRLPYIRLSLKEL